MNIGDGRARPGLVHLALAIGGFAIGTTEFASMSLIPFMAEGLEVTAPQAGHVISAYALGVVIGAPLIATLGARIARRTLLVWLMLVFAVANALSAMAPNYGSMLVFRFLSGFPHGAYFGIAALVAASLVPQGQRTRAVARVMLGLTVATLVGVPMSSWLGQALGWRWAFALVTLAALLSATLVFLLAPRDPPDGAASARGELTALGNKDVWLTLGIGAIGFGGMFCVYTYLASTLLEVTRVDAATIPIVLAIFGLGTTLGNLIVPRFADRAVMPTAGALLLWSAGWLALYPFAAGNIVSISLVVLAIGIGGALGTVLQTRLMDVAGGAQGLAASLHHSAFNMANALGPALGGAAIAAGHGWTSTGWVGCGLALGGFAIWVVAALRGPRPAFA